MSPQPLKTRFNGNSKEVVEYARTWGIWKAMEKYEVKDYIAMCNFLESQTGNPHFGVAPVLGSSNGGITVTNLLDEICKKITTQAVEIERLRVENNRLRESLEIKDAQNALLIEPKIQELVKLCKEAT